MFISEIEEPERKTRQRVLEEMFHFNLKALGRDYGKICKSMFVVCHLTFWDLGLNLEGLLLVMSVINTVYQQICDNVHGVTKSFLTERWLDQHEGHRVVILCKLATTDFHSY